MSGSVGSTGYSLLPRSTVMGDSDDERDDGDMLPSLSGEDESGGEDAPERAEVATAARGRRRPRSVSRWHSASAEAGGARMTSAGERPAESGVAVSAPAAMSILTTWTALREPPDAAQWSAVKPSLPG
jgi:hypothetical protein